MHESNLFQEVPIGFAMELAKRPAAMNAYAALPQSERDALIRRARHTVTREDMEALAEGLVHR